MSNNQEQIRLNNLTEIAYSRFCSHYSRRNWFCNEPNYSQLRTDDKKFWIEFVSGIKNNFNAPTPIPVKELVGLTSILEVPQAK